MRFEFYVFKVPNDIKPLDLERKLNEYGASGWELASIDMALGWLVMVKRHGRS